MHAVHEAGVTSTWMWAAPQAVPATVLALVDRIVRLQEAGMPALPPQLPKARLRDYAQLPQRAELAALTDNIAALAHGVLAMERHGLKLSLAECHESQQHFMSCDTTYLSLQAMRQMLIIGGDRTNAATRTHHRSNLLRSTSAC